MPATKSALILYVAPSSPIPIGAITGINGEPSSRLTTSGSILCTVPVFLKSINASYYKKHYSADSLSVFTLVIAATDSHNVNQQISVDAHQLNIPVNVVECAGWDVCFLTDMRYEP